MSFDLVQIKRPCRLPLSPDLPKRMRRFRIRNRSKWLILAYLKPKCGNTVVCSNVAVACFGLPKPDFEISLNNMEAKLSPKHLLVMLLAVFLTAGFSMSVAQASAMSATMTMAVDDGMAMTTNAGMKGDCKACLKDAGGSANPMHCPPSCIATVLAVLPQGFAVATVPRLQQSPSLPAPFLRGRSSLPDPYPPRPSA